MDGDRKHKEPSGPSLVECETEKKPLHQEGYRMAQYQITVDDEILEGLFQRDGGVAKLVESVVNQILQAQVQEQLKAAPYERTKEGQGYRNGTVTRTLTTRVG